MEDGDIRYILGEKKSFRKFWKEFFQHRELLYLFAWRDLKLKYRQTILGFTWVILQPLIMMGIFTSVFAQRIETGSTAIPYPILVFSGLIVYGMFSNGVSGASNSLVLHGHIIKKTYFPRIILPVSAILASAVDFVASLVILLILMAFLGPAIVPVRFFIFSILAFLLALIPTLGFGILFSALNVRYRDINFIIPFFLMIMLFISPVIYPVGVPSNDFFQFVLMINPLSGPIELMKAGIHESYVPNTLVLGIGLTLSAFLLIAGIAVFVKVQKNIADII